MQPQTTQNSEIAQQLNQLADLLEIQGDNPFRIRAYRNAARTLLNSTEDFSDLVHQHKDLSEIPSIGKDLAGKIKEIVETGHFTLLEQTKKKTPEALSDFLKIATLGPKRVKKLFNVFGVKTIPQLKKITENKKILNIPGFGEKTRIRILEDLDKKKSPDFNRLKLHDAQSTADLVLHHLKEIPLNQIQVAGSYRRRQETVGDLDILASSSDPEKVMEHFLKLDSISKVLAKGNTRSTVILRSGIQVDLRVVPDVSYGASLLYFTGSKAHNIALRFMAIKHGMKLNEYGIFKGSKRIASQTEEEIYSTLKLPFIEPELRENRGEIEAALHGKLPKLISLNDIRGDLHAHTIETDGIHELSTMALAAKNLGYSYLGISDHSKRMSMTHGLDSLRLLHQIKQIDRLNQELRGITILKSIEVDIMEDGHLDLEDEVLSQLDYTICSIHTKFKLTKEKQTARILRAMENPHFKILGHPTGRMIGEREAYDLDLEKIIRAAKKLNKILEINAQPERMDLSDLYCRMAKDAGVKMAISTDAHSTQQLNYMNFGVGQARRGWLEKADVINTLSLNELKKALHAKA